MPLPNCLICHEDLDGSKDISALHCGHVMHHDCVRNWALNCRKFRVPSCPACGVKIEWTPARGTVFKLYLDVENDVSEKKQIVKLEEELKIERDCTIELREELKDAVEYVGELKEEFKSVKESLIKLEEELRQEKESVKSLERQLQNECEHVAFLRCHIGSEVECCFKLAEELEQAQKKMEQLVASHADEIDRLKQFEPNRTATGQKLVQCGNCKFIITCSFAYPRHLMFFHGTAADRGKVFRTKREVEQMASLRCQGCDFETGFGNEMAAHLVEADFGDHASGRCYVVKSVEEEGKGDPVKAGKKKFTSGYESSSDSDSSDDDDEDSFTESNKGEILEYLYDLQEKIRVESSTFDRQAGERIVYKYKTVVYSTGRICRRLLESGDNHHNSGRHESGDGSETDLPIDLLSMKIPSIPADVSTLISLARHLAVVGEGLLILKNSAFPVRFHLLMGDERFVRIAFFDTAQRGFNLLNITHQLTFNNARKIYAPSASSSSTYGHAVLLAMPGYHDYPDYPDKVKRSLQIIITYMKRIKAAGVIRSAFSIGAGRALKCVFHAFPACDIAHSFLKKVAPGLGEKIPKDDHLVLVLKLTRATAASIATGEFQ